jgi:hypothetical protein
MRRERASASATRLVSMVIHRRPHCSALELTVPPSAQKPTLVMPFDKFGIGPILLTFRQVQLLSVEPQVLLSVVKNFPYFITNNKSVRRVNCRIASIEHTMYIFSK